MWEKNSFHHWYRLHPLVKPMQCFLESLDTSWPHTSAISPILLSDRQLIQLRGLWVRLIPWRTHLSSSFYTSAFKASIVYSSTSIDSSWQFCSITCLFLLSFILITKINFYVIIIFNVVSSKSDDHYLHLRYHCLTYPGRCTALQLLWMLIFNSTK